MVILECSCVTCPLSCTVASSVIRTPSVMVYLGSVQISEFVWMSEIHPKNNSKHHINYDDASFKIKLLHSQDRVESYLNIGLVTSMAFSLCCWPKPKIQCSSGFSCAPIFKRLFLHAHVGHFLCDSFKILRLLVYFRSALYRIYL